MQIDQDMVAYYYYFFLKKKKDFDSKDSEWKISFKIDFQRDLLKKVFYF